MKGLEVKAKRLRRQKKPFFKANTGTLETRLQCVRRRLGFASFIRGAFSGSSCCYGFYRQKRQKS